MSITSNILTDTITLQSTTLLLPEIDFYGEDVFVTASTNNPAGLVYYAAFASEQVGITEAQVISPTGEIDSGFVEAASIMNFTLSGGEYRQRLYLYAVQDDAAAIADPVISGVSVTETADGATITWTTDIAAIGRVDYGSTSSYTAYEETVENTSHSVTITGLGYEELVHYQVSASTTAGGSTIEADATFTTLANPAISDVVFSGWSKDESGGGTITIVGDTAEFTGTSGARTFLYATVGNGVDVVPGTYEVTFYLSDLNITQSVTILGMEGGAYMDIPTNYLPIGTQSSYVQVHTTTTANSGEWLPRIGPGARNVSNAVAFTIDQMTIEKIA